MVNYAGQVKKVVEKSDLIISLNNDLNNYLFQ